MYYTTIQHNTAQSSGLHNCIKLVDVLQCTPGHNSHAAQDIQRENCIIEHSRIQ